VIDKLEVTVDPEVPLNAQFESEYRRVRKMPDKIYKEKASIKPLGMNAMLFRYCRFNATHKLSIVKVSRMTIQDVAALIVKVFDCDPWDLRLGRVDFAIDLRDVAMDWIRAHVRVPHKRWKDERGFDERSKGLERGKTLYIGSRADLFRFYDKGAQLAGRSVSSTDGLGTLRVGGTLSRIEHQLRRGRIPLDICTLKTLAANATSFKAFAPLTFVAGGREELKPSDYSCREYFEGTQLRHRIEQYGLARTWQFLNENWGNAGRMVARLADFVPPTPTGFRLPRLSEMHREGLRFQLGISPAILANPIEGDGEGEAAKTE
jgi:Replication initiation factor